MGPQCAVVAQNHDAVLRHGVAMTNPAGVDKTAFIDAPQAARWTARHASLTFNQLAADWPACGVNETGLAIVALPHDLPLPEVADSGPAINEWQWLQYQLDRWGSVDEVLAALGEPVLAPRQQTLHYLVADAGGHCAIVEFQHDVLRALKPRKLCGCSEVDYQQAVAHARRYDALEPQQVRAGQAALERGAKAMLLARRFMESEVKPDAIAYAFEGLHELRQRPGWAARVAGVGQGARAAQTVWQVVFDLRRPAVHFRNRHQKGIVVLDLRDLNLTRCTVLDLDRPVAGRPAFRPCSSDVNAALVQASFKADRALSAEDEAALIGAREGSLTLEEET